MKSDQTTPLQKLFIWNVLTCTNNISSLLHLIVLARDNRCMDDINAETRAPSELGPVGSQPLDDESSQRRDGGYLDTIGQSYRAKCVNSPALLLTDTQSQLLRGLFAPPRAVRVSHHDIFRAGVDRVARPQVLQSLVFPRGVTLQFPTSFLLPSRFRQSCNNLSSSCGDIGRKASPPKSTSPYQEWTRRAPGCPRTAP